MTTEERTTNSPELLRQDAKRLHMALIRAIEHLELDCGPIGMEAVDGAYEVAAGPVTVRITHEEASTLWGTRESTPRYEMFGTFPVRHLGGDGGDLVDIALGQYGGPYGWRDALFDMVEALVRDRLDDLFGWESPEMVAISAADPFAQTEAMR